MSGFADLAPESEAKQSSYAAPADGWYTLQVTDNGTSEIAKGGSGHWFEVEILDECEDRGKTFRHFCATKAADSKLRSGGLHNLLMLCNACGYPGYRDIDPEALALIPFRAEIASKPQKNNPRYTNTNIIKWAHEADTPAGKSAGNSAPSSRPKPGGAGSGAASSAGADWRKAAQEQG